jgi:hypothetical protein
MKHEQQKEQPYLAARSSEAAPESMAKQRHAAGPWRIHERSSTTVVGSHGYVVAACGGHADTQRNPDSLFNELQANARLVASAPELLEHLYAIAGYADTPHVDPNRALAFIRETARAAIKKAEGSVQ